MLDPPAFAPKVHAIKHQPKSHRYFFDVAIGSICLSGANTGGAYCLLEVNLASGIGVPRHTHTVRTRPTLCLPENRKSLLEVKSLSSERAILSWPRVECRISCAIPGMSRITISSYSRLR